jgi:adhesin transport system outer membrane protein
LAQDVGGGIANAKDALAVAVREHPALRAKRSELTATQSDVEAARWQYWATPTVSVSKPDKAFIAGTDRSVSTVGVRQPLWTGGRLEAGVSYAQARHQTAQASLEETRRDIALETIQTWGEVCTAQARVAVYEASLQTHQKFLQQIKRRTQSGLSVQSDIALASSRLDAVLADLAGARVSLQAALERLRTLTDNHPVKAYALPQRLLTDTLTEDDVQAALQLDPSLVRLNSELRELQAQIDSSKAAYWPELYANVTQRHGDVTGKVNQIAIGFESRWGAGLSNTAAVQAGLLRMQAKQEDIEFRTRKLTEQIRGDQQQLQASRARMQAYRQALASANDVARSWDRQFAAGKKSWQEVMNAARESTQTEVQLVDATGASAVLDWRLAVLTRGIEWVLQSPKVQP